MGKIAYFLRSVVRLPAQWMSRIALGFAAALVAFVGPLNGLQAGESPDCHYRLPPTVLPGIGAQDARIRLDPNAIPWRTVGKLQMTLLNRRQTCTGTLIGPSTVLTAAHCVFNALTHRNFLPESIHFLIGYDGSRYAGHATGVKLETGLGFRYDPAQPCETVGSDWALIWLDTRLGSPDRFLPIIDQSPDVGSAVMLGGYQLDHPLVLTADAECRIVGRATDASGRQLMRHNCTGTYGDSGAPLLIEQNGQWYVAGVNVTAQFGAAGGLAVVLDEARKRI